MKALTTFFVLLLLFGCDNAPHKESEVEGNTTNTKAPSESLPVIDFPLLGEARPVDLFLRADGHGCFVARGGWRSGPSLCGLGVPGGATETAARLSGTGAGSR